MLLSEMFKSKMSQFKPDQVSSTNNNNVISPSPKRIPKCAKCRNHALEIPKKGHKGNCWYEDCTCPKCTLIVERREVLAKLVRIRRQHNKSQVERLLQYRPTGCDVEFLNVDVKISEVEPNKSNEMMAVVKTERVSESTSNNEQLDNDANLNHYDKYY